MSTAVERFTATLSQPRAREITTRRPLRVHLQIRSADTMREVDVCGPRITFGSNEANTVFLEDQAVSRIHCELCLTDTVAILRDLGSKNGTWIGGIEGVEGIEGTERRLKIHEIDLAPGSSFSVGSTVITLRRIDSVDVAISTNGQFGELHGCGPQMSALFAAFERLAPLPIDVLLTGPTGTGKEVAARALHRASGRSGPFVVVECPTLSNRTVEVELFGRSDERHEPENASVGLIACAHQGTLFLDEVGEIQPSIQPMLLRALDRHEIRQPGQHAHTRLDLRIISSTRHDLTQMVGRGDFRDDLYFRLAEVSFALPSLRDRGSADISMLADVLLAEARSGRKESSSLDKSAHSVLVGYSWPGNVRQLRSVIQNAALWSTGGTIGADDLPPLDDIPHPGQSSPPTAEGVSLDLFERALQAPWDDARRMFERIYASRVLQIANGNQSEAARRAGMSRSSFRDLLKRTCSGEAGEE